MNWTITYCDESLQAEILALTARGLSARYVAACAALKNDIADQILIGYYNFNAIRYPTTHE